MAACDDADPCTEDVCDTVFGCAHVPDGGLPGLLCVCGSPAPAVCDGERLPAATTRRVGRACVLFSKVEGAASKRRRRLLSRAAAVLQRAAIALGRAPDASLSPRCRSAALERLRSTRDRARALAQASS